MIQWALILALLLSALSGCESVDGILGGGAAPGEMAQNVAAPAALPDQVVAAFMEAWGTRNYDAMYAMLSTQSQGLTTVPVFRAVYTDADTKIGTTGVTFTVQDTLMQGDTAAVTYDAVITSSIFGEIPDAGRMMRLVETPAGWRVAWTTMDIFDGYAAGTTLNALSRRPPRGSIYDRSGIPIVEEGGSVTELYVVRGNIPDEAVCLETLAYAVRRPRAELATYFALFNTVTEFGFGEMDTDEYNANAAQLEEVCAVFPVERTTRRYAWHGAASHVTGFIGQIQAEASEDYLSRGYSIGDLVGQAGIEAQYEEALAGSAERFLQITEPGGLVVRELAGVGAQAPQSVTLTLDATLQEVAGQALADAFNYAEPNWASREHSTGGGVVVIEIDTGAVLALSSYPTFDPGIFNPDTSIFNVDQFQLALVTDSRRPFVNRVTQEQYPPGSTFKIITTAAAAAENVWQPDQDFNCTRIWNGVDYGDTRPERYDWRNFEAEEFNFDTGLVDMDEALAASCNPFFYQVGALLYTDRGPNTLIDYARRMGLGRPTGFDLIPQEASGQLIAPNGTDAAISSAIGQGDIQVTMIQMAQMVAGVANGGTLYRPYIVQSVNGVDGQATFTAAPEVTSEMNLPAEALEVVQRGMCQVTDSNVYGRSGENRLGTAWFVFSDPGNYPAPYRICGKTGTAQTGRIEPMGWFVAFAPADDPQIAIAGMIEYGREGSETIAPVIRRILDTYFNVPPDQVAPFPDWWTGSYVPLNIPEGSTGV